MVVTEFVGYRVVDYLHITPGGNKVWKNTDPKGQPTTDGTRMGQGNKEPNQQDIEDSPHVNLGFQDADGNWHYYWVDGPFDSEFWLDDAIIEIVAEYLIVMGEEFAGE
jgi:hypothetical protein